MSNRKKTLYDRLEKYNTRKALDTWNNSNYRSKKLLHDRVKIIIEQSNAYFITFTISPDNYGLNRLTYQRKVKEALQQTSLYIANEDYGKTNGRYHIHALVLFPLQYDYTSKNHYLQQIWRYGGIDFESIHTANDEAITNYINKFTSHAIKDSSARLIYSRGFVS